MQEVKAIIRLDRLNAVLHALHEMPDLPGVTVSEVRGIGHRVEAPIGETQFGEKIMAKLEIVVPGTLVQRVLETIETTARTGRHGDGKVFVYPVTQARRIRTGEADEEAL